MGLSLVEKQFVKRSLTVATILAMNSIVHAQTDEQQEIQQLRAEVAELRALIQQQLKGQPESSSVSVSSTKQTGQIEKELASTTQIAKLENTEVPSARASTESTKSSGWLSLADGQTKIKPFANIRIDSTYDFKGTNDATTNISNPTQRVPLNSADGTRNALNVSAATTKFGIDFSRLTSLGLLTGRLDADFMGSSSTNGNGSLRLRHAFVASEKWLVGQTTSPFTNPDTAPESVDYNGPIGYSSTRAVQVRYTQPINPNQKVLLALEGGDADKINTGNTKINEDGVLSTGGNRLPALTARYDIKTTDDKFLAQAHGLLHENRVSTNNNDHEEKLAWGVGLGARYKITEADILFANYYHIRGDSRYLGYGNPAYVASKNIDNSLSIAQNKFSTGLIGYSHIWSPQWRSTIAAGGMWYNTNNDYADFASRVTTSADVRDGLNKTLYNIIVNSFYSPVKNIDLGMEYTYGQRKIFEQLDPNKSDTGDYSRFNLMVNYNF